jgi:hypothetical protein
MCGLCAQGKASLPARGGAAIAVAHLARGFALLLGEDDLNDAALELAAIHVVLRVVRMVNVGELDEGERLRAPAASRSGQKKGRSVRGSGGRRAVKAGTRWVCVSCRATSYRSPSGCTRPSRARTARNTPADPGCLCGR